MLSIQNRLQAVKTALLTVTSKTYHYTAPTNATLPYIVWYEESESGAFEVNNHKQEQAVSGWIEFYTKTEFDSKFDDIQNALNGVEGLSWNWNNTTYGDPSKDDDKVIHSTWSFYYG